MVEKTLLDPDQATKMDEFLVVLIVRWPVTTIECGRLPESPAFCCSEITGNRLLLLLTGGYSGGEACSTHTAI